MTDLVFLDLETSGLNPDIHSIAEFAAMRTSFDLQTHQGSVNRLVQFSLEHADPKALEICGYKPELWRRDAVAPRVALADFDALVRGEDEWALVGHNLAFDWMFLRETCRREGFALPRPRYTVDTLSMAWPMKHAGLVESLKLDSLCTRYGIAKKGAHRAFGDVMRTAILYCRLLGMPVPMRLE